MKAYKGFDKDLKCLDFQYKIGETYTHKGDIEPCESGFHACEYPLDVFNYYPPAGSRFAEVETSGKIVPQGDKICCEKIKVKTELTLVALIQAAVNFTFERAKWTKDSQTKKEKGAASATGNRGAASATGECGAASATGDCGAASAVSAKSYLVAPNTQCSKEAGIKRREIPSSIGEKLPPICWEISAAIMSKLACSADRLAAAKEKPGANLYTLCRGEITGNCACSSSSISR